MVMLPAVLLLEYVEVHPVPPPGLVWGSEDLRDGLVNTGEDLQVVGGQTGRPLLSQEHCTGERLSLLVREQDYDWYLQATLSPSLWQVNSMALSTMSRLTFSPAWSLPFRHCRDTPRNLARQSRAAGIFTLQKPEN